MLMRVVESVRGSERVYPEISGRRVLITGVKAGIGAELALAFAEHDARLILAFDEDGAEVTALTELVAQVAGELKVFTEPVTEGATAVRLARAAAQAHGGLDIVINLADLGAGDGSPVATAEDVEQLVVRRMTPPCLFTRIAANRMQLTMNEGLILNIATFGSEMPGRSEALAAYTKSALVAMTRSEARRWAPQGIRINAVAPAVAGCGTEPNAGAGLPSDQDVTALCLFLASGRGRSLSGLVFDAKGVARSPLPV